MSPTSSTNLRLHEKHDAGVVLCFSLPLIDQEIFCIHCHDIHNVRCYELN